MKSDLDELIEHYEVQAAIVDKDLQECLLMQDYLGAHDYSRSLNLIKSEIYLLRNLKDPLYDDKLRLENLDKNIDYLVIKFKHPKEYWQKRFEVQKIELRQLIEKGKVREFNYDSQEIDDALFDLYERKIKGFKLYLKEEDNFYFEFKLAAANILEISIEIKTIESSQCSFYQDIFSRYKKLGFKLNNEETLLTFEYNMNNFKDAIDIKTLLAQIVFKIYSHCNFANAFLLIKI